MSTFTYPVACWPLTNGLLLAWVLGTDLQVVGDGWRDVAGQLKSELARRLLEPEEHGFFVEPAIVEPEERRYTVKVRPAYLTKRAVFPASSPLSLPITAIVGLTPFDAYTCFLPQIGGQFTFYSLRSLQALVRHFVLSALREWSPEQVHGLLRTSRPRLETIDVPASRYQRQRTAPPSLERLFPKASAVAEPFPPPPSVRKAVRAQPGRAWERGEAVNEVEEVVFRERGSLLLVGEAGVGKTAILSEAIRRVRIEDAPGGRPAVWRTTSHRLVSGAMYLGDWQQMVDELLRELADHNHSLLWVEDVVNLLDLGGDGPEDSVASFLMPAIRSGDLRMVGEVRPRELDAARSLFPGFVDSFRLLPIQPLGRPEVFRVLGQFREYFGQNQGVTVEPKALNMAYRLSERFQRAEAFPGKTLSILIRCVNEAQVAGRETVDIQDVVDSIVRTAGLPEILLRDEIPLDPEDVVSQLTGDVLGQDEAVREVARIVGVFKTGLNDPDKPVAALLFAGPTGVGKTALAGSLARFFFGAGQKKDPLIRLDMSELQHPAQMERLIGTHREPGSLIQRIRERPFSVLLLDEIEKAHPAFFDTLLTMLDEGLLFDALGRPTDFRNAIIIMTSNLGAGSGSSLGFLKPEEHAARASAIRAFFRPEFLNRIDRVITFKPLGRDVVGRIARKELAEIGSREGLVRAHILLEFTHRLEDWIVREGFDERYGARRLQRVIEQRVVAALSRYLLENPGLEEVILEVDWVPAGPREDGGGSGRIEIGVSG